LRRKPAALALLTIGIILFALGFFVAFYSRRGLEQGAHSVKAGGSFELSWYLEKGDRTEGGFSVSGGKGRANLIVKSPSGEIIENWTAQGRFGNGFDAYETGTYTMIFKNLDNVNDQTIDVGFLSPYDPILPNPVGLLMVIASIVILIFGLSSILRR
jgi:hypothetical protein